MKAASPAVLANRVVNKLKAGGNSVAAVDMRADGSFRILFGKPVDAATLAQESGSNEWDEVLRPQ